MSAEDRATVKTYVPTYQKEEWAEHADALDMSQSEFVRTMVQAGRTDFDIPSRSTDESAPPPPSNAEDDIRDRIRDELSSEDAIPWDTLVDRLVDGIEDEVERVLEELQADNTVIYSGRKGGYVLQHDD